MIEAKGNMWDANVDAYVITTNGFVKKNGELVMGRGCALEAKQKFPGIAKLLGYIVNKSGNVPVRLIKENIISFPVKHNWWEAADLKLIEESCMHILHLVDENEKVAMPRPGCGNGKLDWSDVKPILEKYLDDRFIVYDF